MTHRNKVGDTQETKEELAAKTERINTELKTEEISKERQEASLQAPTTKAKEMRQPHQGENVMYIAHQCKIDSQKPKG